LSERERGERNPYTGKLTIVEIIKEKTRRKTSLGRYRRHGRRKIKLKGILW
jgi:hypothetical protein